MTNSTQSSENPDVIVVGAGNAALCAAIAASEAGMRVRILEAAPESDRGGNSHYTGGAFRFAYSGVEDLFEVNPALRTEDYSNVDFGTYTVEQFLEDMFELTEYRTDPELCELLVRSSLDTAKWIARHGVKLEPGLGRQAFNVDGKFKFWGGLALHIWGGGAALLEALYKNAHNRGIEILYECPAHGLIIESGRIAGVRARHQGRDIDIRAGAVILACGGFESNPEMRAAYLGKGWDVAKVRGTKYNMGWGLKMALAAGAKPHGNWSGCHSVAWDVNAPPTGDLSIGDQFQKHNYPFGIMVNALGRRYVDEGANFHSHTYAKYGAEIMKQPGMTAWQIFDAKAAPLLRSEYRIRRVTKVESDTIEGLVAQMEGVDQAQLLKTIADYNAACADSPAFQPNIRDGRSTRGLEIEKTNWANRIDTPPFQAFHVTTGVTFTFGGVKVTNRAEVEHSFGGVIPGLYAAGEMVGGLYYQNYGSGTGLMSGATFGRFAGAAAAEYVAGSQSAAPKPVSRSAAV